MNAADVLFGVCVGGGIVSIAWLTTSFQAHRFYRRQLDSLIQESRERQRAYSELVVTPTRAAIHRGAGGK